MIIIFKFCLFEDCGIEIERTRQLQEHHSINFYKHNQLSGWEKMETFRPGKIKDAFNLILVQIDNGHYPEHSPEFVRWKEWREKAANELRQSVSIFLWIFDLYSA